mgnify:CR=1 FL=1|jgi:lipoate-protein ligase B
MSGYSDYKGMGKLVNYMCGDLLTRKNIVLHLCKLIENKLYNYLDCLSFK